MADIFVPPLDNGFVSTAAASANFVLERLIRRRIYSVNGPRFPIVHFQKLEVQENGNIKMVLDIYDRGKGQLKGTFRIDKKDVGALEREAPNCTIDAKFRL